MSQNDALLDAAAFAVRELGAPVVLLESVTGPSVDCRRSILAAGCQLAVTSDYDGAVTLAGGDTRDLECILKNAGARTWDEVVESTTQWARNTFGSGCPVLAGYGYESPFKSLTWRPAPHLPSAVAMGFVVVPEVMIEVEHSRPYRIKWHLARDDPSSRHLQRELRASLDRVARYSARVGTLGPPGTRALDMTKAEYVEACVQALHHIRVGDIYQVVLGIGSTISSLATAEDVYRSLRSRAPSPYMFWAEVGSLSLCGASPEMLVRREAGVVSMRPLAGTAPPGTDEASDIAAALASNPKERAEHIMLVDLCRNDLGRVSRFGSVHVPQLMEVIQYSTAVHMVSTVVGRVDSSVTNSDILRACTPAGTMTGAPVHRARGIVGELEASSRSLYAGCITLDEGEGQLSSCLIIRTAIRFLDGPWSIRGSAGIVAESNPSSEWTECLTKMLRVEEAVYYASHGA